MAKVSRSSVGFYKTTRADTATPVGRSVLATGVSRIHERDVTAPYTKYFPPADDNVQRAEDND